MTGPARSARSISRQIAKMIDPQAFNVPRGSDKNSEYYKNRRDKADKKGRSIIKLLGRTGYRERLDHAIKAYRERDE